MSTKVLIHGQHLCMGHNWVIDGPTELVIFSFFLSPLLGIDKVWHISSPRLQNILTLAQWTFLTLLTFWVVWKIVDVCWFPWLPWASTTRNLHVGHVPLSGWCMVTCTVFWCTNPETPGKTKRAISQGNIPNWLFQQLPTRAAVPHIYLYIYHNISRHIPCISAKLVVVNTDTYLNSIIPFSPFGICPIFHVGCWPKPMVRKIPWSHYTILHTHHFLRPRRCESAFRSPVDLGEDGGSKLPMFFLQHNGV